MSDTGFFQINDIVLDIPPSQIQVAKMNHANKVSNLRSVSDATIWSRNTEVSVNVKLFFSDTINEGFSGFEDLTDLVAQLRVTPFCYIKNEFIRSSILGAEVADSMIFALRSVNVSTASTGSESLIGIISVELDLSYFNHNSYISEFLYKKEVFGLGVTKDPRESKAWRIMYQAEKIRRSYLPVASFTEDTVSLENTTIGFHEFRLISISEVSKKLDKIEKSPIKLGGETDSNQVTGTSDDSYFPSTERNLNQTLADPAKNQQLDEIRDSYTTSMLSSESALFSEATSESLVRSMEEERQEFVSSNFTWDVHRLSDGSLHKLPKDPFKPSTKEASKDSFGKGDLVLFSRPLEFDFFRESIHILGININLASKVTSLPLLGSDSPTFQYVGGSNASISISLKTTSEKAVQKLVAMEKLWRSQTNRMRSLPLKLRRIKISNDFLNMCGLHNFLLDNISISTSPGEPECKYIHLNLTEKEFDGSEESFTYETFRQQFDGKTLETLYKTFTDSLKLIPDIFSEDVFSERISLKIRERRGGGKSLVARQIPPGGNIDLQGEGVFTGNEAATGAWSDVPVSAWNVGRGTNLTDSERKFANRFKYGVKVDGPFYKSKVYDRIYYSTKEELQTKAESIYRDLMLEYSVSFSNFTRGLLNYLQVTEHNVRTAMREARKSQIPTEMRSILSTSGGLEPIEWEYKRWKFIESLKDNQFLGIQRARRDAFSLVFTMRDDSNYYSNLLNDKVQNVLTARGDRDRSGRVYKGYKDLSETEYDEKKMWRDLSNQDFALEWAVRRRLFFKKLLDNRDYLRVIGETEPIIKELLEQGDGDSVNSGTSAYPDFPMPEVIGLIQKNYPSEFKNLQSNLKDLNGMMKRGKFLSLPRMFGPDFYLNSDPTPLDKHIGINKLKSAIAVIGESQQEKPKAYNSWLGTLYKKQLGKVRYEETENFRLETFKKTQDESFWATDAGKKLLEKEKDSGNLYLPSDYDKTLDSGLQHYSSGTSQIKDKNPISNPTDSNILSLKRGDALSASEREIFGHPDFEWPVNIAVCRSASEFGYRSGIGGTHHDGRDLSHKDGGSKSLKLKISAAADGHIVGMSPKSSFVDTGISGETYTQYFLRHDKKDFPGLSEKGLAEASRKKRKYSSKTWSDLSKKKYDEILVMTIEHKDKWFTKYMHVQDDDRWKEMYARWVASGKRLPVEKGDVIATMGNTGRSTGPHLHFEVRSGGRKGTPIDPRRVIDGGDFPKRKVPEYIASQNQSVLANSWIEFEKSTLRSQGMIKAFPAYKLYFIESDDGERGLFGFDDYFSYQAVQEIQVVRNADNPVDLCIIKLTNLTGNLSNRKFRDLKESIGDPDSRANRDKPNVSQPNRKDRRAEEDPVDALQGKTDTMGENPITSLLLKAGTQIQLRMGYSPNPDELTVLFNGQVMDIQYQGSDDIITIVCQSFGMELVNSLQGMMSGDNEAIEFEDDSGKTGEIIEKLMVSPELKHFGRWRRASSTGFEDIASGEGASDSWAPLDALDSDTLHYEPWKLQKAIYGDNIHIPAGGTAGLVESSNFKVYKTTIWDVVQELTHRHPGMIAAIAPYEGSWGPRMTLYFGLPAGNYIHRDPTGVEKEVAKKIRSLAAGAHLTKDGEERDREFIKKMSDVNFDRDVLSAEDFPMDGKGIFGDVEWTDDNVLFNDEAIGRDYSISKALYEYSLDTGMVKSFRAYHLLTNMHNIIENNIISSAYSTFNSATVEYTSNEYALLEEDDENRKKIKFHDAKTLTLKADAGIRDEEIREVYAGFPNCIGVEQAKRYGQSLLWRSMQKGYRGGLVILGDANIKPHDVCYIFDEYTEMFGPVEVEQVVHRFSHQSGFVTEILPRMCVHTNEEATLHALDVMGMYAEDKVWGWVNSAANFTNFAPDTGLGDFVENVTVAGAGGATLAAATATSFAIAMGIAISPAIPFVLGGVAVLGLAAYFFTDNLLLDDGDQYHNGRSIGPLDAFGLFCFRKTITRTQMQHLFQYSPLTVKGSPLLGGLPVFRKPYGPGSFIQHLTSEAKEWYVDGVEGEGLLALQEDQTSNPEFYDDL